MRAPPCGSPRERPVDRLLLSGGLLVRVQPLAIWCVSPVCALRGDPLLFLADQFPFTVDSPRNALKIVFVKGSHTLSVRGIEIRF